VSCHTCLDGPCDGEFHESSLRIRRWLLDRVTVTPPPIIEPKSRRYPTGLGDIHSLFSPSAKRKKAARK
jgi:hypothetical protein